MLWLVCLGAIAPVYTRAQTTVTFEGFDGFFAFPFGWTVGDSNAVGTTAYWDDVDSAFGGEGVHGGTRKGYCAGFGFGGTAANPLYQDSMNAQMSRLINLTPYPYANLRFWMKLPSVGAGDNWTVSLDGSGLLTSSVIQSQWTEMRFNLNSFAGTNRTLNFRFVSTAAGVAEGLYLDDIIVTGSSTVLTQTFGGLTLTNYTGYVIDADSVTNDPAFNRESLLVNTVVTAENFLNTSTNVAYQFTYRLRDTNGNLFPIFNIGGVTNAAATYIATNTVSLAIAEQESITNLASLRPAARLSHLTEYRIEVEVASTNGVVLLRGTNGPHHFYHFTNTTSVDPAYNVIAEFLQSGVERYWLIDTAPGSNTFLLTNDVTIRRYDNFAGSLNSDQIPVRLDVELRRTSDNTLIPLVNSFSNFTMAVNEYVAGTPPTPRERTNTFVLEVRPAVQLDSVNATYRTIVRMSYTNQPSQPAIVANSITNGSTRFLHFNGSLAFGDIETTFSAIANEPTVDLVVLGSHIDTQLAVSGNSGTIDGNTSFHYGNGSLRNVNLLPNGDAIYDAGNLTLPVTGPALNTVGNVRYVMAGVVLGTNGASAGAFAFQMPAGSGWNTNIQETLIQHTMESLLFFSDVGLNDSFAPKTNLTFNPVPTLYCVEESKPIYFQCDAIVWVVSLNRFNLVTTGSQALHTRGFEYFSLAAAEPNLLRASMAIKKSNDRYYNTIDSVTGTPFITADANNSARLSATLNFSNGTFITHFPYNVAITWSNTGVQTISSDLVSVGASSQLSGVANITTPYTGECEGCGPAFPSTNLITARPPNGELRFTRDGGLITTTSSVPIISSIGTPAYMAAAANKLAWGYIPDLNNFAQSVLSPTNVTFHMPGIFLRGDQNTSTDDNGPGVLLLTGVQHTNLNSFERPKTGAYQNGFADYAGINVRVIQDSWRDGRSTICGQVVNYKMRGNSKYYARPGGVTGIHNATPGTFPSTLNLWGYSLQFSNYSLAYMDSENVDSETDGLISVPYPSQFDLAFQDMTFTCPGGLLSAELPESTGRKYLVYWNADFDPLALNFVPGPNGECDPGEGYLTLGVRAFASHVPEAMYGTLGFKSSGDLIARSDGVPGVDSRLQMTANATLNGPNNTKYVINPVTYAYYNRYDPGKAPNGFINFAGKINIPFFEDLKVQVHTGARENAPPNTPVHLMGGWPRSGSGNPNYGWEISGDNYFSVSFFDESNSGFPGAVASVAEYRNFSTQQYHPRAQKLWLDVVDLDYSLAWDSTLRTFSSFAPVENDLLVLHVEHKVTYMDGENAVIDFGIQYDGLPKISISSMLINQLDEATGAFSALSDAIGQGATEVIGAGFDGFKTLLEDTSEKLIDEVFDVTLSPIIDEVYDDLHSLYNSLPNKATFPSQLNGTLNDLSNQVRVAYQNLAAPGAGAGQLLGEISGKLDLAKDAISTARDTLGEVANVVSVATELINVFAPAFGADVQQGLNDAVAAIEPVITQVETILGELENVVTQVQQPLQTGQEWANEINDILQNGASQLQNGIKLTRNELQSFFNGFNYAVDNPFSHYSAEELKAKIKNSLKDRFLETVVMPQIQTSIKQRVYDIDEQFRSTIDAYFGQVNNMIRDVMTSALQEVDNTINEGLGVVADYLGAGKIQGHAEINGDALRQLRIDAEFRFKIPEEMIFKGFLEIKELNAETSVEGCAPETGSATQVTIGAIDIPLQWISPGLRADVTAQFVIDDSGLPLGVGGSFAMRGEIDFGGFTVKQIGFAVAFGAFENYFAANARVKMGSSIEIAGGAFFGRACSIQPITIAVAAVSPTMLADVNPSSIFGDPPFTGAFVYGEGRFPIWSYGCLFEVRLTLGGGGWYFKEGPRWGGIIKAGIGGTVICVLSADGTMTLIAANNGKGMTYTGLAHVEGCLGWCPFCICVDADTAVQYSGDWEAEEP